MSRTVQNANSSRDMRELFYYVSIQLETLVHLTDVHLAGYCRKAHHSLHSGCECSGNGNENGHGQGHSEQHSLRNDHGVHLVTHCAGVRALHVSPLSSADHWQSTGTL